MNLTYVIFKNEKQRNRHNRETLNLIWIELHIFA